MPLTALLRHRLPSTDGNSEAFRILSTVLDAFPVASFVIDARHRVVHWNRASEILTGVPAQAIVGTSTQGQVFYGTQREVMADLIVNGAADQQIGALYEGKLRPSTIISGTYEAEDFFPQFGDGGRWLFFTAAPLYDANGTLIGAIETLQDITERRRAEEALKASEERFKMLSRTDPLTQIFNFRHFHEELASEICRSDRYGQPLSLITLDVDHFKQVNDRYGHQEGDRVLRLVAEEILRWKRRSDSAFRCGGDEFAVLLPATSRTEAETAAARLAANWSARPVEMEAGSTLGCTLSIGVAQYMSPESPQDFIRRSDQAAYEAKRLGRNRIAVGE